MAGDKNFGLDSAQVCDIIEACGKSGVTSLKFRDLEIKFGPTVEQVQSEEVFQTPPVTKSPVPHQQVTPEAEISDETHEKLSKAALEEDELLLREEQVAELMITDPLAMEEMIRNGELEDADDESESVE